MSWNKPTSSSSVKELRNPAGRSILRIRTITVCIIVMAGGVGLWLLGTSSQHPASEEGKAKASDLIKEVEPSLPAQKVEPPDVKLLTPDEAREKSKEDRLGNPHLVTDQNNTMWFRGAKVPVEKAGAARRNGKPWGHREFFKSAQDNLLAKMFVNGLVTGPSAAPQKVSDKFYEALEKSLSANAEIVGEETAEAKDVAAQLAEVKQLISAKIAAGETLKGIMEDAFKDRDKIAAARKNYQEKYYEMMREGASPQDLDDLVNAANSILRENFAAPIKHNPRIAAKLYRMKRESEQK